MANNGAPVTNRFLATLRTGWIEIAGTQVEDLPAFSSYLDELLGGAVAARELDEEHLLDILSSAKEYLEDHDHGGIAVHVYQSLLKSAYEYLLAIDTLTSVKEEMIGFEEVDVSSPDRGTGTHSREITGSPHPSEPETAVIAPDTLLRERTIGSEPDDSTPSSERDGTPAHDNNEVDWPDDSQADAPVAPQAHEQAVASGGAADPEIHVASTANQEPQEPPREHGADAAPAVPKEFHIVDPKDRISETPEESDSGPAVPPLDHHEPASPAQPKPKRGSHTHPHAVESRPTPSPAEPSPVIAPEPAQSTTAGHAAAAHNDQQWEVRKQPGQFFEDDEERHPPHNPTATSEESFGELKSHVEHFIRQQHGDKAASLLQQAAHAYGGQDVAELALDTGDRCRALGKQYAAINCYLASMQADPLYIPALSRLADVSINLQDINTAVGYLERTAHLMRLRGDASEALRMYRKIITLAPYREDILEVLMRARANGHLDR